MESGKEHYRRIADDYMSTAPDGSLYHAKRFQTFNSLIPESPSRVLDFGCGSGENLKILSSLGHTVTGIDPAEGLIEQARKNASDVHVGDVTALSEFGDGSFDVVAALSVLSYLDDSETKAFYEHARRLLAPNGTLVLSYSNALVDMMTFNRYTVEFWRTQVIPFLTTDKGIQGEMLDGLKSRLAFPDEPKSRDSEIDKVVRNRRNPFLIGDELSRFGFTVDETAFMHWHPLPPQWLENSDYKEVKYSNQLPHWTGYLFASMFVVRAS